MTDKDLMPFGKHKGALMEDVPADYLLWLRDEGCSDLLVRQYIEENLTALLKECPNYIEK